ncbi:MAG: signal recognition particle protein [Rhodospirillales bacterium]
MSPAMFDGLTQKLSSVLDSLTRKGALKEADIDAALREARLALLDADVALDAVKPFIDGVREKAVGQDVIQSVTPGQMIIKIMHDHLAALLGGEEDGAGTALNLAGTPPVVILLVGLQGAGKTTTAAKLGRRLSAREGKNVLMASLDVHRPAAQRQLQVLGGQADVSVLANVIGEQPVAIAKRALKTAKAEGRDVLILDSAGRLHVDFELMGEIAAVREAVSPLEILLTADALAGQDAAASAKAFNEKIGVTGIVLTRVDGDARGGAALSMRTVTGKPIKFMGVGEQLDALEPFDARRVAGSILGQGDIVGLVERAGEIVDKEKAEKLAVRALKGQFTLNDMAEQFRQLRKMGDLKGLLGMIPGAAKMRGRMDESGLDKRALARSEAVILSMTPKERESPKMINGSRRKRIAAGSGVSVPEVNRLLKQHRQMSDMMKKAGKSKHGLQGLAGGMPGLPPGMAPPLR